MVSYRELLSLFKHSSMNSVVVNTNQTYIEVSLTEQILKGSTSENTNLGVDL